jgi:hypothetical protein
MAQSARELRDAGARIIGGCCGMWLAHIRAMAEGVRDSGTVNSERKAALRGESRFVVA